MSRKKNFIRTFDKETADKLKDEGFTCIDDRNGQYLFINNLTLNFTKDIDSKKVDFTDLINM